MTSRSPPTQKALPLPDWPKADRETWQAAQEAAGVLDEGGTASHLSPLTRKDLTRRYGYFLSFLTHRGRLDLRAPRAAAMVTADNIVDYVHYLEPRVSSVTLAQSVYKIARVAHCLAPGRDWRWLRLIVRRLDMRAKPRDKRNEVVSIKELYELGLQLMDQAETATETTTFCRAMLYRDGLIIALLSADPIRLANSTALEMGKTLIKDGTTWSFDIPPEETKGRRQHLAILPDWSAPRIDRFIQEYRPIFRNAELSSRVWLSQLGRPLSEASLYRLVCKRTLDAFGKRINPHLFRSCLSTSAAVHHGAHIGLAMTVLDHRSVDVFQRHYNQARMIDAVRAYQKLLDADSQD